MNSIKVPYVPFDCFKPAEEFLEGFEESNEDESPVLKLDDDEDLPEDVQLILHGMGMAKYIDLFKKRKVLLDTLLKLDEADLKELGIEDPDDRRTIVKKLGTNQTNDSVRKFIVKENSLEDLQIAKNVSRHLLLLQNYGAYVELQLKKNKLTDYSVDSKEFASLYLKAFTETALIQSRILSGRVYDEYSDSALIDQILKKYNLTLPPVHQKELPKKKRRGSSTSRKVVTVLTVSSLIVIIGKYLMRSTSKVFMIQ